jgi:phosphoribosylformylglycinamidine synthase
VFLFSESAGRALVAVPRGHEKAFTALCDERGLPWTGIGLVDQASGALEIRGQFTVSLDELREAYTGTLPTLFGGPAAVAAAEASDPADAAEDVPAGPDARTADPPADEARPAEASVSVETSTVEASPAVTGMPAVIGTPAPESGSSSNVDDDGGAPVTGDSGGADADAPGGTAAREAPAADVGTVPPAAGNKGRPKKP